MHRARTSLDSRRRALGATLLAATLAPCMSFARVASAASWTVVELGADVDASVTTGALAVNHAGIAAGWVGNVPALFTPDGRAERLGARAGRAMGFDADGRVVGRFLGSDEALATTFVRHGAALVELPASSPFAPQRPAPADANVALPGAFFAQAYGGNRGGDVVGTSDTGPGTAQRAVMRLPGGNMIDLGALAPVRAAGWRQLLVAYAINDRGAVVGVGTRRDGALRGFMLLPPSP
jgi:probable HAF family extracellular repeat protein